MLFILALLTLVIGPSPGFAGLVTSDCEIVAASRRRDRPLPASADSAARNLVEMVTAKDETDNAWIYGDLPPMANIATRKAAAARRLAPLIERYLTKETLEPLQNASLHEQLLGHGVDPKKFGNAYGRDLLKQVSEANLARELRLLSVVEDPETSELRTLIASLVIDPVHNTWRLKSLPRNSLLSSRQLSGLGNRHSANTHFFNEKFMQSDDNLFFNLYIRKKSASAIDEKTEYGGFSIHLDHNYAREDAWVSVFIMDMKELTYVAKTDQPELYRNLQRQLVKAGYEPNSADASPEEFFVHEAVRKIILSCLPEFSAIRSQLYRWDFTVDDFETLLRTRILHRLQELKKTAPEAYAENVRKLRSPETSPQSLSSALFRWAEMYKFELKVPVAVPHEELY